MSVFRKLFVCSQASSSSRGSKGSKGEKKGETDCAVCQDSLVEPCTIPCGNSHVFCLACLKGIVSHNNYRSQFSCPLCRKQVRIPMGGLSAFRNDKGVGLKLLSRLPVPRPRRHRRRRRSSSSIRSSDYLAMPVFGLGSTGDEDLEFDILSTALAQSDSRSLRHHQLLESLLEGIHQMLPRVPGEEPSRLFPPPDDQDGGAAGNDNWSVRWRRAVDDVEGRLTAYQEELDMRVVLQIISDMEENERREEAGRSTSERSHEEIVTEPAVAQSSSPPSPVHSESPSSDIFRGLAQLADEIHRVSVEPEDQHHEESVLPPFSTFMPGSSGAHPSQENPRTQEVVARPEGSGQRGDPPVAVGSELVPLPEDTDPAEPRGRSKTRPLKKSRSQSEKVRPQRTRQRFSLDSDPFASELFTARPVQVTEHLEGAVGNEAGACGVSELRSASVIAQESSSENRSDRSSLESQRRDRFLLVDADGVHETPRQDSSGIPSDRLTLHQRRFYHREHTNEPRQTRPQHPEHRSPRGTQPPQGGQADRGRSPGVAAVRISEDQEEWTRRIRGLQRRVLAQTHNMSTAVNDDVQRHAPPSPVGRYPGRSPPALSSRVNDLVLSLGSDTDEEENVTVTLV